MWVDFKGVIIMSLSIGGDARYEDYDYYLKSIESKQKKEFELKKFETKAVDVDKAKEVDPESVKPLDGWSFVI